MSHKKFIRIEIGIFIYAILPILSIILAMILAAVFGCGEVNEGSAPTCVGGDLVYSLFVLGWLGVVTIPTGTMAMGIALLIHLVCYLRSQSYE